MTELEFYIEYLKQNDEIEKVNLLESIKSEINSLLKLTPFEQSLFVKNVISDLFNGYQLCPITLDEKEWDNDINIRNNNIYKFEDKYYFNHAVLFYSLEEKSLLYGDCDNITSVQEIKTFPFIPKSFNVQVITLNGEYHVLHKNVIDEIRLYYP